MRNFVMMLGKKWVGVPMLILLSISMLIKAPRITGYLILFTVVVMSLMVNWFIALLKDMPYSDLKEMFEIDDIPKEKK